MTKPTVLVVGSGVAGLTAALEASTTYDVTLVTKAALDQSNTSCAQGGIAVAATLADSIRSHIADTMAAGAGLSAEETVRVLCAEGPAAIDALIGRGVEFDRVDGALSYGLEAAHSHARILHAGGDATGAGIANSLIGRVRESTVVVRESTSVADLIVEDGRVTGIELLGGGAVTADVVILATGGAGQLYPYTTNPEVATGDGVAMALRAGAAVADLEFYQFHPTALDALGNFLISEAVRGEGAVLIGADGRRFMRDVHPSAELAPRDVVARGIATQMAKQPGTPVCLDATSLGTDFLAKRFPTIDAACRMHGFDWSKTPIPVTPAAHYSMGGIRTDEWGRSSLPGLYVVGEAACNGLHGANRLASNSLLEGAVYAARCVAALAAAPTAYGWEDRADDSWDQPSALDLSDAPGAMDFSRTEDFNRTDLQRLMWEAVGLARSGDGLRVAQHDLSSWRTPVPTDATSAEDGNLLLVARAMVAMALAREESRGGHFRSDFPERSQGPARHSALVADVRSAEEALCVR